MKGKGMSSRSLEEEGISEDDILQEPEESSRKLFCIFVST